jgi:hypothetical protein
MKATIRRHANYLKNDYSCELLTPFKKALQKHIIFSLWILSIAFLLSQINIAGDK